MGVRRYKCAPIDQVRTTAANVGEEEACLVRASESLVENIMARLWREMWTQITIEAAFEASAELAAEVAAQQHPAKAGRETSSSTQTPEELEEPCCVESGERPSDAPSHRQACSGATGEGTGAARAGPQSPGAATSRDSASGTEYTRRRGCGGVSKRPAATSDADDGQGGGRQAKKPCVRRILPCDEPTDEIV
jgi:hypothetical protein